MLASNIPTSVRTALLCPVTRSLSVHTNKNNTNIKHRSNSALVNAALLVFVRAQPKASF